MQHILLLLLPGLLLAQLPGPVESQSSGANLLLAGEDRSEHLEPELKEILIRRGPNIRASADYHDFQDIKEQSSIEALRLMQRRAFDFAKSNANIHKETLSKLLSVSNVSLECSKAAEATLEGLGELKPWAVKMWSSSGNFPPVGLFDGSLTDLGSYYGCMNAIGALQETPIGRHTSYCMLSFRPVIPSRPKNHMVFYKLPDAILNTFNDTENIFYHFVRSAQYYHYFYMKTSVCVPSACSPEDVQRVAALLSRRRLFMMNGPVKCYTRSPVKSLKEEPQIEFGKIEDEPILMELAKPMNNFQWFSLVAVMLFFSLTLASSAWHASNIMINKFLKEDSLTIAEGVDCCQKEIMAEKNKLEQTIMKLNEERGDSRAAPKLIWEPQPEVVKAEGSSGLKYLAFEYFSVITHAKDLLNCESVKSPTEIKCLHGLRVITMAWVILVHTLQYNAWDGFTRIYENEGVIQNVFLHPLYNATYVVDNFFFMSGLLASYTILLNKGNSKTNFNLFVSFLSRYLRLTPQVLLVSLLYTLLPLVGEGPFWYDMTHYSGKYCEKNWWVNLLHLQSFYRKDEICNLVSWWISVDMFYYITALILLFIIIKINNHQLALNSSLILAIIFHAIAAYKHYTRGYTPNNLGTIPQVADNWTGFVVDFFWSPMAHVCPFYLGFWFGYLLSENALKAKVQKYQRIGWLVSSLAMGAVSYGTRPWMSGALKLDNQLLSTSYNSLAPIVWALSFAWIVMALHYDCGPTWLNELFRAKLMVVVSKLSFIVYLSHMLLLRYYFGVQTSLIEVSTLSMVYIVNGHILLSILFGFFINVTFEGPCLKFQKFATKKFRTLLTSKPNNSNDNENELTIKEVDKKLLKM